MSSSNNDLAITDLESILIVGPEQALMVGYAVCGVLSVKYGYGHHTLVVRQNFKAVFPIRAKVSMMPLICVMFEVTLLTHTTGWLCRQFPLQHRLSPISNISHPPLQARLRSKVVRLCMLVHGVLLQLLLLGNMYHLHFPGLPCPSLLGSKHQSHTGC